MCIIILLFFDLLFSPVMTALVFILLCHNSFIETKFFLFTIITVLIFFQFHSVAASLR